MFRFFERRIDPYPKTAATRPPEGLFAFLLHYSRPVLPWLLLMSGLTAIISVLEVTFFSFLGTLVDWLASEMLTYDVKPEIEAFDLSHIRQAAKMFQQGKFADTPYVQFVMGVKNAMPVDRPTFDFYIETLKRLAPDAQWCAAGIGAAQLTLNEWSISKGGHTRTGMEDNVRLDRDTLAPSNAALVRRAVELCDKYERPVATWQQARDILGLRQVATAA